METREKRKINLLYTHLDSNNNFLANGNELGVEHTIFNDGNGYISTHLAGFHDSDLTREIEVNKTHISNFDENEIYFYIISHPALSLNECLDTVFPVNKDVIDLSVKYDNIYITFLYEHEPDDEDAFPKLIRYVSDYSINPNKVIILNNNSKLYDFKKQYKTDIKVHKSGFLAYSSYRVLRELDVSFVTDKKGKFFISRNRNPKQHRVSFILHLYMNNLIDEFNYSFIPENGTRPNNIYGYLEFFDTATVKENEKLINFINTHSKIDDYESKTNWISPETNEFNNRDDQGHIFLIPELKDSFENSYINVVTESVFNTPPSVIHISEKSFRPFYYYQLPIFVASLHHVSHLREDYGFDLFDDIIDHSYDFESNPKIRLQKVIDEIKRISKNKDSIIDFYKNNQERFEKNREIYKKIGIESKKKDFDFFWNLLCD